MCLETDPEMQAGLANSNMTHYVQIASLGNCRAMQKSHQNVWFLAVPARMRHHFNEPQRHHPVVMLRGIVPSHSAHKVATAKAQGRLQRRFPPGAVADAREEARLIPGCSALAVARHPRSTEQSTSPHIVQFHAKAASVLVPHRMDQLDLLLWIHGRVIAMMARLVPHQEGHANGLDASGFMHTAFPRRVCRAIRHIILNVACMGHVASGITAIRRLSSHSLLRIVITEGEFRIHSVEGCSLVWLRHGPSTVFAAAQASLVGLERTSRIALL
mmetsp:Transcript_31631/g.56796  ORF Transcript_31631/g.56796 Transcript_31631/m.56796 type:complete len:272 (+) Transcript_31631:86-901(+)